MTELLKLFLGGAITKNEYYKRLEQASKDSLQRTAADKIDEVKKLQRKLERALAFTCLLKAMGLFGAKLEEEELDVRLVKPEVEAKVKENDEWVEIRGALPDNGQRALTLENEKLKMVLEQAKKILE